MSTTRIEHDAFGPVNIPAERYWGAQTQRALEVFGSKQPFPASLIRAFGQQKRACARANARLGALTPDIAHAIEAAAQELADGHFDEHFPLSIWQTGSGTQTNMNANEVIANRANRQLGSELGSKAPVHPNDHVNRSQSSNDSFPTVMHLTTVLELRGRLLPALSHLHNELQAKAEAWQDVLKIGRTHLMDAVPMSQGQAFGSFAEQIRHGIARIEACMPRLRLLPQGGTAVGTGLNTPAGFDVAFCEEISRLTGERFETNPCKFEGMGTHDALVEASGALNVLAVSLTKIANDIRLLGSGPRCGLGELIVPDDGLTSSIMPGKRNPTIAEVLVQAAMQVMGNHTTITLAGASSTFELNVAKPVLIHNLLQSIDVLTDCINLFGHKLLNGLEVNRAQLAHNVEHSLLMATVLNPVLGYDRVARITRKAADEGLSPREAAVQLGFISAEEYTQRVRPDAMIRPTP
ncbi:class II fumarate hydratase [Pseudomonas tolaasii]|uniref:Fumarate hydratase class II n=2 Tax=Pseudomonas tolaasii TaxID=29442 RepID=A0A7Y8AVQ8_PSETO|nr:class II fumarate hydratase [Pseudomonas tolaasii]ARB29232.1 class II fumarate hydratase [Pseudomonas tolaasii]KAB0466688.1 class II fumarate hydratase [Pseudomonas tolaasii]MBY8943646.1 class II fumarate hydratase [Pseudomonas tolaasii]NWC24187.1 class II fumarate hydratase [Pseudomonas tolaasii]NWC37684.1 class II fumarate hydratase [Pseudomonas tolaasii]